jgi:hypothetical protein
LGNPWGRRYSLDKTENPVLPVMPSRPSSTTHPEEEEEEEGNPEEDVSATVFYNYIGLAQMEFLMGQFAMLS